MPRSLPRAPPLTLRAALAMASGAQQSQRRLPVLDVPSSRSMPATAGHTGLPASPPPPGPYRLRITGPAKFDRRTIGVVSAASSWLRRSRQTVGASKPNFVSTMRSLPGQQQPRGRSSGCPHCTARSSPPASAPTDSATPRIIASAARRAAVRARTQFALPPAVAVRFPGRHPLAVSTIHRSHVAISVSFARSPAQGATGPHFESEAVGAQPPRSSCTPQSRSNR